MPKPNTKHIRVVPVVEVEICPECGSDDTRCENSEPTQACEHPWWNYCLACKNSWNSDFPSSAGVKFVREEELVLE